MRTGTSKRFHILLPSKSWLELAPLKTKVNKTTFYFAFNKIRYISWKA